MRAATTHLNLTNTPDSYLTGLVALNLPAPEGITGDWHKPGIIQPGDEQRLDQFCAGGRRFPDTRKLMGLDGVHDCAGSLRSQGLQPPAPSMPRIISVR